MYMPLTTRNLVHVTYEVRALHARLALYFALVLALSSPGEKLPRNADYVDQK